MGNQCGSCSGAPEEGEISLKTSNQRGAKANTEFEASYENHQDQIVKIQSHVRGRQARKQFRAGKYYGDKLSQEPGLEFKEELVFPDGTVYKGQVKEG